VNNSLSLTFCRVVVCFWSIWSSWRWEATHWWRFWGVDTWCVATGRQNQWGCCWPWSSAVNWCRRCHLSATSDTDDAFCQRCFISSVQFTAYVGVVLLPQ